MMNVARGKLRVTEPQPRAGMNTKRSRPLSSSVCALAPAPTLEAEFTNGSLRGRVEDSSSAWMVNAVTYASRER
jgi:hypothetical protein